MDLTFITKTIYTLAPFLIGYYLIYAGHMRRLEMLLKKILAKTLTKRIGKE